MFAWGLFSKVENPHLDKSDSNCKAPPSAEVINKSDLSQTWPARKEAPARVTTIAEARAAGAGAGGGSWKCGNRLTFGLADLSKERKAAEDRKVLLKDVRECSHRHTRRNTSFCFLRFQNPTNILSKGLKDFYH